MRASILDIDLTFKSCHNSSLDLDKNTSKSDVDPPISWLEWAIKFSVVRESLISLLVFFFLLRARVIASVGKKLSTGWVNTGNNANIVK